MLVLHFGFHTFISPVKTLYFIKCHTFRNSISIVTSVVDTMKEFKKDDSVEWNTPQGKTSGKVIKKVTKPVKVGNYTAKASTAEPKYEVKTTKSHKVAVHKADSLKKSGDV